MWFIGVEVEQEMSAPPPKKNPGSAPDYGTLIEGIHSLTVGACIVQVVVVVHVLCSFVEGVHVWFNCSLLVESVLTWLYFLVNNIPHGLASWHNHVQ